jgi:hypothetical protein
MAALLMYKNGTRASTKKSSETNIKQKMLGIQSRLAFSNGVLLENRVCLTNALLAEHEGREPEYIWCASAHSIKAYNCAGFDDASLNCSS